MESISDKKKAFKVQIRRKRVEDKISLLRAAYHQQSMQQDQQIFSAINIAKLIQESLSSKQKLIQKIGAIKSASFHINQKNSHLFFPLIKDFCYILGNLQEMGQNELIKDKHLTFNQIITCLINISSNQAYLWPVGEYLPIIKNLLVPQREINTMWLLSNILYQKPNQNADTAKQLTLELVKYDSITFCQQRLSKKFQNQQDILVFACFVCTFLTNSVFLTLQDHKKILSILQELSTLNLDTVDWFIFQSMIDHAPYLSETNYQLIYSEIMTKIRENYIKKKKSKVVIKYLEFVRTYIFCEVQKSINLNLNQDGQQIDSKVGKSNYQRILTHTFPNLMICLENRSPEVKALLMQIASILLQYYFPFIDIENQDIYLNLAAGLSENSKSVLSKYSSKALYWQLRLVYTLLKKIKTYKIQNKFISQFVSQTNVLEALGILLKDKSSDIEIISQIVDFLLLLFEDLQIITLANQKSQATQVYIDNIKQTFESIIDSHVIQDQTLYNKIQSVIDLIENKKY